MAVLTGIAGWNMCGRFSPRSRAIMATAAIGRDRGMPEVSGPPGIGIVAFLTGLARGDMVARFALRRAAIMAGSAATGDVGMAEARTGPGRCAMAGIAGDGRRHRYMTGRQTHGLAAIMAGDTSTAYTGVIDPQYRFPTVASMTVRAIIRTEYVITGFAAGGDKPLPLGMTALAVSRGTLEDATYMTGLTLDLGVGTVQGKPGPVVVEAPLADRCRLSQRNLQNHQTQQQQRRDTRQQHGMQQPLMHQNSPVPAFVGQPVRCNHHSPARSPGPEIYSDSISLIKAGLSTRSQIVCNLPTY